MVPYRARTSESQYITLRLWNSGGTWLYNYRRALSTALNEFQFVLTDDSFHETCKTGWALAQQETKSTFLYFFFFFFFLIIIFFFLLIKKFFFFFISY